MRAATLVATVLTAIAIPAGAVDCPFDPSSHKDAQAIRAEVSRTAELVAPSSSGSTRRRSVGKPPIQYFEARNFIDTHILDAMKRDSVAPAKPASDIAFLRRITVDLAGRIPTIDEVKAFLADTSADKRDRTIDRLLASEDFNDRWTLWFGDLVQNTAVATAIGVGVGQGSDPFFQWTRDSIKAGKPYDAMVREMLTAAGNLPTTGPANYTYRWLQSNGPIQDTYDNLATQTGAQFLGMQLMCISCHNGAGHLEQVNFGLSRMPRRQLWEMAAFFSHTGISLRGIVEPNLLPTEYKLNTVSGNKSPRQPLAGESDVVLPRYLNGGAPGDGELWRTAFARLLTADRQFARAAVNYIWKEMFGLGIVEPVNGFDPARLESQATHPKLLEDLTDTFIASGYDLRALMRLMAQSNTYQLSSRYETGVWSERLTPYFARHYPRRLMAEVLFDAIYQASGQKLDLCAGTPITCGLPGARHVTKAVGLPDPYWLFSNNRTLWQFLADFGQGDRDVVERSSAPSLVQAISIMNDQIILRASHRSVPTTVAAVLRETQDPSVITERLYLATLSRFPTEAELAAAASYLRGGKLDERTEDLQFVLLNKLEFLFN